MKILAKVITTISVATVLATSGSEFEPVKKSYIDIAFK